MSKITQIHNNLISVVSGVLPTFKRIPNPYFIDENNQLFLVKGFGIGIGTGHRQDLELCKLSWNRIFQVVLVQQIVTTENNISDRIDIEQAILESHHLVLNALETNSSLNGSDSKADVIGDTGLVFLTGDRLKYLSITIDVNILYSETYT